MGGCGGGTAALWLLLPRPLPLPKPEPRRAERGMGTILAVGEEGAGAFPANCAVVTCNAESSIAAADGPLLLLLLPLSLLAV